MSLSIQLRTPSSARCTCMLKRHTSSLGTHGDTKGTRPAFEEGGLPKQAAPLWPVAELRQLSQPATVPESENVSPAGSLCDPVSEQVVCDLPMFRESCWRKLCDGPPAGVNVNVRSKAVG